MLVIRILGLQAALVAAQLLNLPDLPVVGDVGDVVGGLLGGGGGTTTAPDVVAVPDPVATPEPSTPAANEPEVVETVPAPVEVTPDPTPEPSPEPQTPEPTVVTPPVVVVPTPEPSPPAQQQPPADSPAPASPGAVFVPPAQQPPAAAASASPSPNSGAGGVILAPSPAPDTATPATTPATNSGGGMTFFVPPPPAAGAAADNVDTAAPNASGVPTPAPGADLTQDLVPAPNTIAETGDDVTNGQVTKEETPSDSDSDSGGMSNGTKIAAGVAGGAGGVVVLVVVLWLFWKRRMRRSAWRKKLEGPSMEDVGATKKFNVAGSVSSGSEGKVEWVETGHDVTFDFGFEKEAARMRGAAAAGERDVEKGFRVELEGDSPPVSRAGPLPTRG